MLLINTYMNIRGAYANLSYYTGVPFNRRIKGTLKTPENPPHKSCNALTLTEQFCPRGIQPVQVAEGVSVLTVHVPQFAESASIS